MSVAPEAAAHAGLTTGDSRVPAAAPERPTAPEGAFGKAAKLARHARDTVPVSIEAMRPLLDECAAATRDRGRYSIHAPASGRSELPPARPTSERAQPPEDGPSAAEAAQRHARATALAQQGRWDLAMQEAQRAVQLDSGKPQYETTYAWVLFQAGPVRREADAQIVAHLNRALKLHRECAEAHYVLGLLRKRQGKHKVAEEHFDRTLDIDPEHLGAERELRLYAHRRARGAESGLMRRLVDKFVPRRRSAPLDDDEADG